MCVLHAALADPEASLAEYNDVLGEGHDKAQRSWQEWMYAWEENWAMHRSSLFEQFLSLSGEEAVSVSWIVGVETEFLCFFTL